MIFKINLAAVLLFISAIMPVLAAAPDIKAQDIDGNAQNVNQYIGKGKWTAVVFWAHNCPICNREIQQMTFFQDDHEDKDATVLGVSMDGFSQADKSRAFIDRHELNFPNVMINPKQSEFKKFGGGQFVGTPTFYLYNPAGELMATNVGPVAVEKIEEFINNNKL